MKDIELINGDCLIEMQKIKDKSVDMILCDLPYGTTSAFWDCVIPFEPLWEQYNRIIKDNGCIALFGSEPFSSKLRMSNLDMYRYDWVWEKERPTNIFTIKKQVGKVHENIMVFYKKQCKYYPQMEKSLQPQNNKGNKSQSSYMNKIETLGNTKTIISPDYNNNLRYPRSIIKFSRGTRSKDRFHPTQKPLALLEYLIKTYTNEGDLVLDNTMGSGSTMVACVNTNRKGIGIELNKEYFDIATKRVNDAILEKQQSLF